jgi:hypothetical protein
MIAPAENPVRSFRFERDSFAFAHELVWKYHFDPVTGAMTTHKADPPPAYYHRCFVLVRATRQFFDHARFEGELPPVDAQTYRKLIREVVSRNPRQQCAESTRLVIPGYDGLRSFSQAHEPLLKEECGAAWESYFLRSHWRMVFPVSGRHQAGIAQKLERSLRKRGVSLVHLFCFPHITINHGIVLYGFTEFEQNIEFEAYDPNIPAYPVKLIFDRNRRAFTFAPNCYWGGGVLSVIEIFCGGLY